MTRWQLLNQEVFPAFHLKNSASPNFEKGSPNSARVNSKAGDYWRMDCSADSKMGLREVRCWGSTEVPANSGSAS
jgi:hypothetical protein